jgi:hypothetical protein
VSAAADEVRTLTDRIAYLEMQLAATQFALNAQLAFTAADYAEAYTAGRLAERGQPVRRREAVDGARPAADRRHLRTVSGGPQ